MNTINQQTSKPKTSGSEECRTRIFSGTALVVCLMESPGCPWAMPFGNESFCKHPSARQFVNPQPGNTSLLASVASG